MIMLLVMSFWLLLKKGLSKLVEEMDVLLYLYILRFKFDQCWSNGFLLWFGKVASRWPLTPCALNKLVNNATEVGFLPEQLSIKGLFTSPMLFVDIALTLFSRLEADDDNLL